MRVLDKHSYIHYTEVVLFLSAMFMFKFDGGCGGSCSLNDGGCGCGR